MLVKRDTTKWFLLSLSLIFFLSGTLITKALGQGLICYMKQTQPLNDLRVITPDGTNETLVLGSNKLIMNRVVKAYPSWTRDGGRIALAGTDPLAGEQASPQIFILNADGNLSQITQLSDQFWPMWPRFSPDGNQLTFQIYVPDRMYMLIVALNLDGSPFPYTSPSCFGIPGALETLGCGSENVGIGVDWSPVEPLVAGSILLPTFEFSIVVADPYNAEDSLRKVSSPGSVILTGNRDGRPCFSPDGQQIAFIRKKTVDVVAGINTSSIWIVNTDGTGEFQVVADCPLGKSIDRVSWSPEGDRLVYDMGEALLGIEITGESDLFIVDIATRVSEKIPNASPAMSPDWIEAHQAWYPPRVQIPGDMDEDRDVDFDDFFLFAAAFGTSLGDPDFNPKADLDEDGDVDLDDFFLFFVPHFGEGL